MSSVIDLRASVCARLQAVLTRIFCRATHMQLKCIARYMLSANVCPSDGRNGGVYVSAQASLCPQLILHSVVREFEYLQK